MITRAAKEICIYYSCRYYPFFIWNVGIDITGSNNMQNRKNDYSQESGIWHPVFQQIVYNWYHQEQRSYMLQ